jgi:phage-related protein
MTETIKMFPARFFETETGNEPVKEWLLELAPEDRKAIGEDIRVAEFGWPIGMPLCRAIKGHKGLWEIRTNLSGGRKARVFFCAHQEYMVLLHGFIKKSRKTPSNEMAVAVKRMKGLKP